MGGELKMSVVCRLVVIGPIIELFFVKSTSMDVLCCWIEILHVVTFLLPAKKRKAIFVTVLLYTKVIILSYVLREYKLRASKALTDTKCRYLSLTSLT